MTRLSRTLWGAALVLLIIAVYFPAFSGGFVWDDNGHVTDNEALRTADGLRRIWFQVGATQQYYPAVYTTFWLEYQAWGADPRGYHAVNVLLHGLNALLLWVLLRRLEVPGAWMAAAVFAVHPVHVESVAWISERKNVLAGAFYLGSLLAYLRFERHGKRAAYFASFALFVGALLSKTVTCSLPVALLLVLWWKHGRISRDRWWPLVPFFFVGCVLGLVTVWVEKHHIGASGEPWDLSAVERCLIAGRAFWFYLSKLVWPASLAFVYPRFSIDPGAVGQYLFPLAAVAALATLWLSRRRLGRGPFAGLAYFAVTLVPALGFFDVFPMKYSFVADHYQYLASIGPISLVVAAILCCAASGTARIAKAGVVVAAVALSLLGGLTWRQARLYQDVEKLWRDTMVKNPTAEMVYTNLGNHLLDRGRTEEAVALYREAIALEPGSGDGPTNLGNALLEQGRRDEALEQYRIALQKDPEHVLAHYNLGLVLSDGGDLTQAASHLERVVAAEPDSLLAHHHLAVVLARLGRWDPAIAHYREVIRLHPADLQAHFNLANACYRAGRAAEAIESYSAALRLDPDFYAARFNLALLLTERGETDEAVRQFGEAVRLRSDLAEPRIGLARALRRSGRSREAIERLRDGLAVQPDSVPLLEELAWALSTEPDEALRNGGEAADLAVRAVELTGGRRAVSLDVLGAAYAEARRFEDAVRSAEKALEVARTSGDSTLADIIATHRSSYRSRRPWREGGKEGQQPNFGNR